MNQNKSEKVIEFERKTLGTLITILDLVAVFCTLLIVIGIFLPICNIDIIGESISLFDFTDVSFGAFLTTLMIILIVFVPGFVINKFRNDIIDNKNDKEKLSKLIFIISIAQFGLVLFLIILNLPVLSVSGSLEIPTEFVSAGAGTIIIYVAGTIYSLIIFAKSILEMAIINGRLELKKIINVKK